MFITRMPSPSQVRSRQKWKCGQKLRLTMEEAGARFGSYRDASTEIYLCPVCGFCHFGHQPVYKAEESKQAILEYKQARYEVSVKRQKSRFREPSWKTDPRMNFRSVRKTDKSGA